jgi:predicted NBD/HSP70 family sugar kinase
VATTLTGERIAAVTSHHEPGREAKACIASLASALLRVRGKLNGDKQQVIGIGVGLPGGVDEATGFLHFAPNLGWRDVPFGALLAEKLNGTVLGGVPLFVQNEADVGALGELEFNPGRSADPLLYVSINQGVGAGVVVGERLLTGGRGFAGEVGHVVLQINGPHCSCGRRGCAEALIGPRAMVRSPELPARPLVDIQHQLAQGDTFTVRAVKKAGGYLGVLLQNLSAAYDPGCIVLGGALVDLGKTFLEPALKTLNEYAAAANFTPPVVETSRFGAEAVAIGSAALVRYRLTRS